MQIEGTDKRIGGIYYYIPNEKCKRYFQKLNDHLGVTPKSVRTNNKKIGFCQSFWNVFVTFL